MGLSTGDEARSAILHSDTVSTGSTDQRSLDADEDREIQAVQFSVTNMSGSETVDASVQAWLGAAEAPGSGGVSDSTGYLGRMDFVHDSDGTGTGGGGKATETIEFDNAISWEKHVTLTIQHAEDGTGSAGSVTVFYTE